MSRTATMIVTYKFTHLWAAKLLIRACRLLRYVVGTRRAERWAINGSLRLVGVRIIKTERA